MEPYSITFLGAYKIERIKIQRYGYYCLGMSLQMFCFITYIIIIGAITDMPNRESILATIGRHHMYQSLGSQALLFFLV